MAFVFIAILLALGLSFYIPDAARLRNFRWLRHWLEHGAQQADARTGIALSIGLPVLVCIFVQIALEGVLFGLVAVLFGVLLLFYCIGPRDLERDVAAIEKAPDSERRMLAAQALQDGIVAQSVDTQADHSVTPDTPITLASGNLVATTFGAALRRWFGVLFWFALLGPAGALLYRITHLIAIEPEFFTDLPPAQRSLALRLGVALDWVPAQLITLALALAGNFDTVLAAWREYHADRDGGYVALDIGFLNAVARSGVAADLADVDKADDANKPVESLRDAMKLLHRVLIAWLALLALILIAGWVA